MREMRMKLHGYWRSGTSYRVRLALACKGVEVDPVAVDLRAGDHGAPAYRMLNPQGLVPTLVLPDGTTISQSGAIIDYLEERYPSPSLLPVGARNRARVRQMCQIVGCDIHPLNNMRVLNYLKREFDQPQPAVDRWMAHWTTEGFTALERLLDQDQTRGAFSFGGQFGMTECYLLPQLYSARRFGIDLSAYPQIRAVEAAAMALPFVAGCVPEAQADAG